MARIGIYGGTFNPIHSGHLHIVSEFIAKLHLDRVLLIPTATPPHKPMVPDAAPAEDRMEMCRLAALHEPKIQVSDCEIRRGGKSYTADTITYLKTIYPDDELFLLMGEDMFLTVETWRDPPRIFHGAVLCAAPRSDDGARRLEAHAQELHDSYPYIRTEVVPIAYRDISSTAVRAALEHGRTADGMVPPAVLAYIAQRGLYAPQEE